MVIPLRDINPRRTFPFVTIALIAINFLFFLYELSLGQRLQGFFLQSAFVPAEYFEPGGTLEDGKSIVLSMFLHGGWSHLLGNMLYLWIFGDNVEDRLGHGKFILFYLGCGWVATLAHGYSNPASIIPSIGASGAIAGVLGAYLIMFPKARVLTLIPLGFFIRLTELPALFVLGFWFLLQLFSGTAALAGPGGHGGVAWWAHIGGFVAGLLVGVLVKVLPERRDPT